MAMAMFKDPVDLFNFNTIVQKSFILVHHRFHVNLQVIGQFNLGFIIGKLDQDLFIVDQVIFFLLHKSDSKTKHSWYDLVHYIYFFL